MQLAFISILVAVAAALPLNLEERTCPTVAEYWDNPENFSFMTAFTNSSQPLLSSCGGPNLLTALVPQAPAQDEQMGIDPFSGHLWWYKQSEGTWQAGPFEPGSPVQFHDQNFAGPWGALEVISHKCKLYAVKKGTGKEGIWAWSSPLEAGGKVSWEGSDCPKANAALLLKKNKTGISILGSGK